MTYFSFHKKHYSTYEFNINSQRNDKSNIYIYIYIYINDLKPIMPFKIIQDIYENHQGGWVSMVFFIHMVTNEK